MKNKVFATCEEAVADITDGSTIMVGGFLSRGTPSALLIALHDRNLKELTIIRNDVAGSSKTPTDVDMLIAQGQVKKVITCFPAFGSPNKVSELEKKVQEGATLVELSPQGTLAERIRAGGSGIGAFYTPVGAKTLAADGKEIKTIDGKDMVLEYALKADFALIKAYKADKLGNLVYRKTARNFNPIMAMAAKTTIVEAERVVEIGDIDPDHVITPAIFVDRIVEVPKRGAV
ncbi:MAG: 3-oxoacid CoA-transferase subunit A [Pseudomonadota bacterium]